MTSYAYTHTHGPITNNDIEIIQLVSYRWPWNMNIPSSTMLLKKAIPDPTALILTAFSALPCSEAFVYCQFHVEKLLSDSLLPRHQSPCV